MNFDLILFDRIEKIKQINELKDLENNAYLSFSGGKDSTVLHYLLDIALPNNKIPRLYINTGIEYSDIRKYVFQLAKTDNRIIIINSNVNIKNMLETEGYPFKSKEHSLKVSEYKKGSTAVNIIKYKEGTDRYSCPQILKYQYTDAFKLKISNKCCYKLKKEIAHKWQVDNNKSIVLTGMRASEGGQRSNLSCLTSNGTKFHPLVVVDNDFMDQFIETYNIKLCRLYYPPFNFKRTGCKGCPFNINLQEDLDIMLELLPNERKQCEIIFGPVYAEMRRIGYRLRPTLNIFELLLLQEVIDEQRIFSISR